MIDKHIFLQLFLIFSVLHKKSYMFLCDFIEYGFPSLYNLFCMQRKANGLL